LHRHGAEIAWWQSVKIDPLPLAKRLWQHTRLNGAAGAGRADAEIDESSRTSIATTPIPPRM
jgi:hypothetical protein